MDTVKNGVWYLKVDSIVVTLFATWYDLYNLKVVEITHGGLSLLVKYYF